MQVRTALVSSTVALIVLAGWTAGASASTSKKVVHANHFAGFEVNANATEATTSFVLPTITCGSTFSGIDPFVGLNNFTTEKFTAAGVSAWCSGGKANYQAYTEINNDVWNSSQGVKAGDTIKVTVRAFSVGTTVTVDDMTEGSATSATQSGPGGGGTFTSVSVGSDGIGAPRNPAPTFGSVSFSATKVNGASFGSVGPTTRYEWFRHGVLQVATSRLSGGTAFSTSQPT
jgi:hypothetical protein